MIFLKLGGSLITIKDTPETVRLKTLARLAGEIAEARRTQPDLTVVIGHGSGSFGHTAAARHRTHEGASTPEEWIGFAEVWRSANRLNRIVADALAEAGLPIVSFPPSASVLARQGVIMEMAHEPLSRALQAGLIPLVQGDVAFDSVRGACIVSTEEVFTWLAPRLKPGRILLAGAEPGVFSDFPENRSLIDEITQEALAGGKLAGSAAVDVTGGMAAKVRAALAWAAADPGVEIRIFSGEDPGQLRDALLGGRPGTQVVWHDRTD